MVGRTLGNYRLLEVLGQGGMGVVYRGEHSLLGRKAAIKVLRTELSRRADIIARFFNEARATSQVSHPSIVGCLDFGHDRDSAYIVMELLEGENLRDRLDRVGRLPWTRAVTIARQVASALGAVHQLGVVHRDLKPDNIFLVDDADVVGGERAKVLDFGIAKLAGDVGVESVFRTRTGSLIGTPVYMSPEQCRGAGAVDERTDIYSLGCVLYQMVCGHPPFVAEGHGDLITMHITVPPTPPRHLEPTLPDWLDHVIVRLLAKNPADRHADMGQVIADLDRLTGLPAATPSPIPAGRVAVGTPAPPTTLGLSAAERMVTPAIEPRPARRWLWPSLAAVAVAAGAIAFALAAGADDGMGGGPIPAAQPVEQTPAAVIEPEPQTPAVAPVAVALADAGPAPLLNEAEPAASEPPRAPARGKRRAKGSGQQNAVREPAPKPERASATRVRGGIAEPDF